MLEGEAPQRPSIPAGDAQIEGGRVRTIQTTVAVIAIALVGAACGYRGQTNLPSDLQRIHVAVSNSGAFRPGLETALTQALTQRILSAGGRVVAEEAQADAQIKAVITGLERNPVAFDATDLARRFRMVVILDLQVIQRRDRAELAKEQVRGGADYSAPTGVTGPPGGEVPPREEFVSRLLSTLLPPGMETLNLDILSGGEATSADIASRCRTIPAFAPRRLVLLKEADRVRSEGWDATGAYLDAPSPATCLICVADKLEHGHRGLKGLEEVGKVLRFALPRDAEGRERQCQQWMRQRARQQGKSLTPEAERLLLTLQGPDLLRLSQEVDKLCLFVGERQEIDPGPARALVGQGRVRGIFELTSAVSRRALNGALSCLRHLLEIGRA